MVMASRKRLRADTWAGLLAMLSISWSMEVLASCGAAFCAVNTNWNLQGLVAEPGWRLDLRYEHINQDQPMAGGKRVAVGQVPQHHDEVKTVNRNYLATLDYTIDDRWGVALTVPASDRDHTHIHNHGGARITDQWNFARTGDVRVLGRHQWRIENAEKMALDFYGLNFGVKLPTGDRDIRNAAGDRAERTLQPGTGTTDLLLGAYYNGVLPASGMSWFVQGLWQTPMESSEDYRPGQRFSLDAGYRYEVTDRAGLMLQVNAVRRERDSGAQAEPANTGGTFLFLTPGASYAVSKGTQIYAFVQKPLYQYVNGVQLTADWSAVLGVSTRF
jgi:Putative MetA-pathway of phenol degradation